MRKRLRSKVSPEVSANGFGNFCNSFDVVGDIAITKLPVPSQENSQAVAQAIMSCNGGVKTVLAQTSGVRGDFRLRGLVCIGGEDRTRTTHREHGCVFAVDVERCYFSPRLSGERLRIANLVQPGEVVVNLFAGVGCFSILIAKRVPTASVYSIDVNPDAYAFMVENVRANRLFGRVFPLLGDAKAQVEAHLCAIADRVLLPLPEKAIEYLPCAVSALRASGGWLHVHVFEHAKKTEDALNQARARVAEALTSLGVGFSFGSVREVRSIGPNWSQVVVDVHVVSSRLGSGFCGERD